MNYQLRSKNRSGLSIAEVGIASMLVGAVIVGSLQAASAVYRTHRITIERTMGPALAHALMSEIMAMPYEEPEDSSLPDGVVRKTFNAIEDFLNAGSEIVARDGTTIEHYDEWEQEIHIGWVSPATGEASDSDTGLKKITVNVFKAANREATETSLVAYRSRDGLLEQPLYQDATLVTWVGAELQLTVTARPGNASNEPGGARAVYSGTPILNHVAEGVEEQ